jgi:pimeloyl-ACP methyl ester carboxylesterase
MQPRDDFVEAGIKVHVREWDGHRTPFVLLHGLASNCRTWDGVAQRLAAAGHRVVAVDQRGHGLSEKPAGGYDFATFAADLARLVEARKLSRPILVGQSWGGNLLLEFGVRYPGLAAGLGFIDGGFIDFQSRPDATWERISTELRPPDLLGTPRETLKQWIQAAHPGWTEAGVEATLANFETLPDGSVRPWLTLPRHMAMLRALWEQRLADLCPRVTEPVLVCAARDPNNPGWMPIKSRQVTAIYGCLPRCTVHWFEDTDHDIHVQRPEALAGLFLETLAQGVWGAR